MNWTANRPMVGSNPTLLATVAGFLIFSPAPIAASEIAASGPSYDCSRAEGEVEELVCADAELAALDMMLDEVWQEAMVLSQNMANLRVVKAEQRGWIKGRNECWKNDDVRDCVEESYTKRISEIQARWRLIEPDGPVFFTCENDPANEIVATFFATDPPTAILERGDTTAVTYLVPAASGSRYEGRNVIFWNKGVEATVTWGYDAETMTCVERGQ